MVEIENKIQRYETYKDSGIAWLGDIPKEWEILPSKRFHKVEKQLNKNRHCDNVLSLTLRGVVNNNPDAPIGMVPKDYATYQVFDKNDLVFKLIDLENVKTSRVGIVHEKGIMSSAYIRLIIGKDNFARYAYYYFFSLYINEVYNNLGSGVRSTLGPNDLLNIPFIKPSLQEQTAIAQFLDDKTTKIEEAIGIKKQQISLLKERKQILIHKAVTQGLSPNVNLKDSGVEWIGEVPEHWEVTKAKYYSTIFVPERAKPDLNTESYGYPWVTTEHLRSVELFETAVTYYVSNNSINKTGSRIIGANSVIATCVGNFGIASKLNFDCIINQQIQGFTNLKVDPNYLTYLVRLSEDYFKNNSTLTTIMYVNKDTFGNMPISLPPISEQKEIAEYIEKASRKIETAISLKQQEIARLKEYKSSLINSAVTGKIKVS